MEKLCRLSILKIPWVSSFAFFRFYIMDDSKMLKVKVVIHSNCIIFNSFVWVRFLTRKRKVTQKRHLQQMMYIQLNTKYKVSWKTCLDNKFLTFLFRNEQRFWRHRRTHFPEVEVLKLKHLLGVQVQFRKLRQNILTS